MSLDCSDVGAVIDALYASLSGPAGPRAWALAAQVFHPQSRQARTGVDAEGRPWMKLMDQAAYRADTEPFFAANGFYEVETARRIEVFGNMAHVWSVYEARTRPDDPEPERRGINSIQLFRDGDGNWSVVHMIWDNERDGVRVPPMG